MTKDDIQAWLRGIPWTFHLVLSESDLKSWSDENALRALRKMNFWLCRRLIGRFSNKCLERRFHWVAFFQGERDAGNRHLHVLLYAPEQLRPASAFERMKIRMAVLGAWLRARERCGPLLPWTRIIQGDDDSRNAATYVSRLCSRIAWNEKDVHFSH